MQLKLTLDEQALNSKVIPTAHKSLLQHIHTTKRGRNERRGTHGWHPYYAGYAEQFVSDVLATLAKPSSLILDPWNGSGTTTLVAQRDGYQSVGVELNPVMAIHAAAKSLALTLDSQEVLARANCLVNTAHHIILPTVEPTSPILEYVNIEPLRALLSIKEAISQLPDEEYLPEFFKNIAATDTDAKPFSKFKPFFTSALFQVLRKVGTFSKASNPTWLTRDKADHAPDRETVIELFLATVKTMLNDLSLLAIQAKSIAAFAAVAGNSKALPLADSTIDLIITSPPYCTRIDYTYATKPELLLLGHSKASFDHLRRANMGAPVIADKSIVVNEQWGPSCMRFLNAVKNHTTKAAKSYYLPNYLQYFRDAEYCMQQVKRVLKAGGQAVIVVQSSYFKDVALPLGEIYVEMSCNLGVHAEIVRRETIRQHMAHINTKSQKYVKNKEYFEDVVLITRL